MKSYLLIYCRHRAKYSIKKIAGLLKESKYHYRFIENGNLSLSKVTAKQLQNIYSISAKEFLKDAKRLADARAKLHKIGDAVSALNFPEKQKQYKRIFR